MEAATLQKKKTAISKGKLKKTIKNVLCRPDVTFWPLISEEQGKTLEAALSEYKVDIPIFTKPHWKELKQIPKEKRPKPPPIKKVEGLIFGISECRTVVLNDQCAAIVVESSVNPRMIVQQVLDSCITAKVPALCMNNLKNVCSSNFGISTCCLGIKKDCLIDLVDKINKIAKTTKRPQPNVEKDTEMDVEMVKNINQEVTTSKDQIETTCPFLYRTSKKSRVFIPTIEETISKGTKAFIGQDFIEFSDNNQDKPKNSKAYMKMMLKRISSNPNRVKVK